ncbi:hypothetical protein PBI_THONKO_22 [Mycobacterium phage Thonko]|uniref:Uncharacterized protein n=1 Tax=Mycobacterium phage Thonko TaxID=2282910 RepID=A0A346FC69_9CAUD|nr:hypothetical protein I5G57_gp022 [Mycobacterium phage Thonko]AXN53294.1 hypothetical protein PBI_THONKO_22 [Mycobacterium phage Thonko]
MTSPEVCVDPVAEIVNTFVGVLKDVFDPDPEGPCPPLVGTTANVRFFAGEGAPLAAWNAHAEGEGCDDPFLWVRVMRRYRSRTFPAPVAASESDIICDMPKVVAVEIGVGRCAVVDQEPSWDDYAREAQISLDDSWRIESAVCAVTKRLAAKSYRVGADTIAPVGPEGGVIAWTAVVYVGY